MSYMNEFIRLKCASDMLRFGLFPNAKEISESFGAYNAVRQHLRHLDRGDPRVTMIAVGDGRTPRTAATFALRSAWQCHSVDPVLRPGGGHDIDRLTLQRTRAENATVVATGPVVIVAVHSHAVLPAAVAMIRGPCTVDVVAIPCCVPQKLEQEPDVTYTDQNILSPARRVLVWRHVTR